MKHASDSTLDEWITNWKTPEARRQRDEHNGQAAERALQAQVVQAEARVAGIDARIAALESGGSRVPAAVTKPKQGAARAVPVETQAALEPVCPANPASDPQIAAMAIAGLRYVQQYPGAMAQYNRAGGLTSFQEVLQFAAAADHPMSPLANNRLFKEMTKACPNPPSWKIAIAAQLIGAAWGRLQGRVEAAKLTADAEKAKDDKNKWSLWSFTPADVKTFNLKGSYDG
jgi:hypothetical protein